MELISLTQEELNGSGIRTALTQNDLIEVIVDERLAVLNAEIDAHNSKVDAIRTKIVEIRDSFRAEAIEHAIAKAKRAGLTLSESDIASARSNTVSWSYNDPNVTVHNYPRVKIVEQGGYRATQIKSYVDTWFETSEYYSKDKKIEANLRVTFSREVSIADLGIKSSESIQVEVPIQRANPFLQVIKELEELRAEAEAIKKKYEGLNVNPESLLKQTRMAINKQLIASSGANLREKIQDVFGLSIEGKKK